MGHRQGRAQLLLNGVGYAAVFGSAAAQDHLPPCPHPLGQGAGLGRHAEVDAGDDILLGRPPGEEGDDLGLGKDRAGAAHLGGIPGAEVVLRHLLQRHLQHPGHDLQKPAGPGGALVVHIELADAAPVIQGDGLHILSADVNDGADRGILEKDALAVTDDLAHLLVGHRQGRAAIASGQNEGHVLQCEPALGGDLLQHPAGSAAAGTRLDGQTRHHLFAIPEDDGLGGGGAHVDAHGIHTPSSLSAVRRGQWDPRSGPVRRGRPQSTGAAGN